MACSMPLPTNTRSCLSLPSNTRSCLSFFLQESCLFQNKRKTCSYLQLHAECLIGVRPRVGTQKQPKTCISTITREGRDQIRGKRDVKSVRTTRAPGRAVERAREFGSSGAVFAWSCRNRVKKQRRSTGTHPTSHDSSARSTSHLHRSNSRRSPDHPPIVHPPVHAKENAATIRSRVRDRANR